MRSIRMGTVTVRVGMRDVAERRVHVPCIFVGVPLGLRGI